MMPSQTKPHLEPDFKDGYLAFKEDGGLFLLIHISGISGKEEGDDLVSSLTLSISSRMYENAIEFDSIVSEAWHKLNFPLSFSIVCVYRKGDKVLLKTYGKGEVRLRRGEQEAVLVSQGSFAEGFVQLNDILTLSVTEDKNTVGICFEENEEPVVMERSNIAQLTSLKLDPSTKRKLLIGALCTFVFIFLWSAGNGLMSKSAQLDNKNIAFTKELITQKLGQAEDVVVLNTGRSVALIIESKNDLKSLEKKLEGRRSSEVKSLAKLIDESEKKILQKNQKIATDFFDLSLEQKGAVGVSMWSYDDKAVIVDPKGAVYIVSLDKKSLESRTFPQLLNISLAGLDDQVVYVFKKGTGVIKVESEESKPTVAIKNDKEWGSIVDLQVFNKNLYLLDGQKGQIYKYIPTDEGFATRSAYFKSGAYAQNANSFAIDQSVYVAQPNHITKYTVGLQDGFAPQYPGKEPVVTRVMTGPDQDDIYLWDKANGSITTLSKTGDYRSEVESAILSKASSVIVYKDDAYALQGSKLFQIHLK